MSDVTIYGNHQIEWKSIKKEIIEYNIFDFSNPVLNEPIKLKYIDTNLKDCLQYNSDKKNYFYIKDVKDIKKDNDIKIPIVIPFYIIEKLFHTTKIFNRLPYAYFKNKNPITIYINLSETNFFKIFKKINELNISLNTIVTINTIIFTLYEISGICTSTIKDLNIEFVNKSNCKNIKKMFSRKFN